MTHDGASCKFLFHGGEGNASNLAQDLETALIAQRGVDR